MVTGPLYAKSSPIKYTFWQPPLPFLVYFRYFVIEKKSKLNLPFFPFLPVLDCLTFHTPFGMHPLDKLAQVKYVDTTLV